MPRWQCCRLTLLFVICQDFKKLDVAFLASEERPQLVTIGITPTEPATGYGYIQKGDSIGEYKGAEVFKVVEFKEKPALETAKMYLESGDYYWNAGMFVWSVRAISDTLTQFTPKLKSGLDEIESRMKGGGDLDALLAELYPELEKISIDFAVMEKADNVVTLAATFDWDDVGAWPAIERHFPKDANGNVANGEAVFEECSGNIVVGEKGHLVS